MRCLGGFFDTALMPVGDAMTGMAGGSIAKSVKNTIQLKKADQLYMQAEAALETAEANAQSVSMAESMQQYNKAADLFKAAEAIETKVNGK